MKFSLLPLTHPSLQGQGKEEKKTKTKKLRSDLHSFPWKKERKKKKWYTEIFYHKNVNCPVSSRRRRKKEKKKRRGRKNETD